MEDLDHVFKAFRSIADVRVSDLRMELEETKQNQFTLQPIYYLVFLMSRHEALLRNIIAEKKSPQLETLYSIQPDGQVNDYVVNAHEWVIPDNDNEVEYVIVFKSFEAALLVETQLFPRFKEHIRKRDHFANETHVYMEQYGILEYGQFYWFDYSEHQENNPKYL